MIKPPIFSIGGTVAMGICAIVANNIGNDSLFLVGIAAMLLGFVAQIKYESTN